MPRKKPSVVVLYNFHGDDEYERLRDVDESRLDFEPEYDIQVPTSMDEYQAVEDALKSEGFRARSVNLAEDLRRLERILKRERPDVVFNLVEYFHDDPDLEPNVPAILELYEVAYTGAPPSALWLCQKKGLTKQMLLANGVPTPRFLHLTEPKMRKRHGLRFPLIVKPALEDASSGIERESVVHDTAQLVTRLDYVYREFGLPILVEEFIDGIELHVSVLGNDPPEVLPAIQWDFSDLPDDHPPIISFAAKWNPLSEVFHRVHSICPPKLPKRVLRRVEEVARAAYRVTGCRDYARLDIRLDNKHRPHVLEVNPNPDLTEGVSFMESAEVGGYGFSETLRRIVEFAFERKAVIESARDLRRLAAAEEPKPVSPEDIAASLAHLDESQA
jgi:D-alanine-D-alanine ligase